MAFHAKGATPLMQAVMAGQWEAAAALVARGARIDVRNAQLGGDSDWSWEKMLGKDLGWSLCWEMPWKRHGT